MLEIRGLDVAYGESQVLWDVSLDVPAGGVVCLMGRNGVGKTTLLKTIMGLLPSRSGRTGARGAEGAGNRLRAPGPRDLSESDREGQPPAGRLGAAQRARRGR